MLYEDKSNRTCETKNQSDQMKNSTVTIKGVEFLRITATYGERNFSAV